MKFRRSGTLKTVPPLQNLLWDILVRNQLKPVALAKNLKQAFLQVCIRLEDRGALRFHWIKDKETLNVEVLRFTCALFRLVQSPFLLGGTPHWCTRCKRWTRKRETKLCQRTTWSQTGRNPDVRATMEQNRRHHRCHIPRGSREPVEKVWEEPSSPSSSLTQFGRL